MSKNYLNYIDNYQPPLKGMREGKAPMQKFGSVSI